MWLQLSGANTTGRTFYYEESKPAGGVADQRMSIITQAGGKLRIHIKYDDGGSPRDNFFDLSTFGASYFKNDGTVPTPVHLAVSFAGTSAETAVTLYLNSVSQSFDFEYVATGGGNCYRPDGDIYLGGLQGTDNTITGTNLLSSSMDEVIILNKVATQAEINELYNNATMATTASFSTLNYSSNVKSHLSFEHKSSGIQPATNAIIHDARGLMDFTASVAVAGGLEYQKTGLAVTPPRAAFTLSGSTDMDQNKFNGDITIVGSSFAAIVESERAMNNGVDAVLEDRRATLDTVIAVPRIDVTGSERNIVTRFSAPGGPEVQTIGYLDAHYQTFSPHNAMPFRNLSVLGSGSGEAGTIRVEDHLGKRRGLKALRTLHMGQFGIDASHGAIKADEYPTNGSYHKQHRNRSIAYQYSSGELIITGSNYDNMHINTPIPRSEYQYSWINASTSGSLGAKVDQRVLGYAPRDGMVSASAGYVEAIAFPSASTIIGST